jgi:hypothetical protein
MCSTPGHKPKLSRVVLAEICAHTECSIRDEPDDNRAYIGAYIAAGLPGFAFGLDLRIYLAHRCNQYRVLHSVRLDRVLSLVASSHRLLSGQ